MTIALIIIAWLIPGVIAHGLSFAWFQRKYPILAEKEYWTDMAISSVLIPLGPINLASWLCFARSRWCEFGFKLW